MTILSPLGKILYTEEDVYKRYHLEVVFSAINQDILKFEQLDHLEEIIDENGPWIGMEVAIRPDGESHPMMATVKRRKTGQDGNPVGQPHNNPIQNTLVYEVVLTKM